MLTFYGEKSVATMLVWFQTEEGDRTTGYAEFRDSPLKRVS